MAGKKKDKVVPIIPLSFEEQLEQGIDPRESMSSEQIAAFIRKEEEQLARRIGKFAVETVKPDTSELEEEDEGEVFTLDLENKTIEQKTEALIVGDEGLVDKVLGMQPANPFTQLITDIYVSKALARLMSRLKTAEWDLDLLTGKAATLEQVKAMEELSRVVIQKQQAEIRACWVAGTNTVKYDKIPEWAVPSINGFINDSLRELIELSIGRN